EIGILLESGRVEPLRDLLGPRPSRTIVVACICDPVRPAGAAERAGCLAGLRDWQGISAGKRRYACNFPPAGYRIQRRGPITAHRFPLSDRQIIHVSD